jgi:hypothetical protein
MSLTSSWVGHFGLQIGVRRMPPPVGCIHALATTDGTRWGLKWQGPPPRPGERELLLLLVPASFECAFPIGSGSPYVARIDREGEDGRTSKSTSSTSI